MELDIIRSITTLILFVLFILLVVKVYSKKNKNHYQAIGEQLLEQGDDRSPLMVTATKKENTNSSQENKNEVTPHE